MNQEERRLEGTEQQPTVTWRAGTEDGLKLAPALTNGTRGNNHKLQVGCLHQEKHLLQEGSAALGYMPWLMDIIFGSFQYSAK